MALEVNKKMEKTRLVLCGLILFCIVMFCVVVFQLIEINRKQQNLANLKSAQTELEQEIATAQKTLELVSSIEQQELQARKKGLAKEGEKRFIAE